MGPDVHAAVQKCKATWRALLQANHGRSASEYQEEGGVVELGPLSEQLALPPQGNLARASLTPPSAQPLVPLLFPASLFFQPPHTTRRNDGIPSMAPSGAKIGFDKFPSPDFHRRFRHYFVPPLRMALSFSRVPLRLEPSWRRPKGANKETKRPARLWGFSAVNRTRGLGDGEVTTEPEAKARSRNRPECNRSQVGHSATEQQQKRNTHRPHALSLSLAATRARQRGTRRECLSACISVPAGACFGLPHSTSFCCITGFLGLRTNQGPVNHQQQTMQMHEAQPPGAGVFDWALGRWR
ncbi:hypothetical protein QBC40DRAFT_298512 [Triangularia verruculosa]|uniref:Uncharacterized protein n=1 Tax=Triangularia verruculosa TaxID=2587418 RepID=A0AAN6XCT6_9PEZI|nr:hypothetical protein QBC40DRAFT_298512 [Triangularia verruculosa]